MVIVLNGKKVSKEIQLEIKQRVKKRLDQGLRAPGLAVIVVGDDPASKIYVRNKMKACKKTGITSHEYKLNQETTEKSLLETISFLNKDPEIDGILLQLPLPKHITEQNVLNAILPEKDVDGFHPVNVGNVALGYRAFTSCTPKGIMSLLKHYSIALSGKHAVIVGRSNIVGKPMAQLLLQNNATVTICHSKTEDLFTITRQADLLIVATGQINLITEDGVKEGAIVVDVGINRTENGLCGDVDFEKIAPKCSHITPVPGGVGPMTITALLENTLESYQLKFPE